MKWEKKDRIFKANGNYGWMISHAQVPTMLIRPQENLIRVYFSTRPIQSQSRITFLDLDINDPSKVIYINENPILELGKLGTFDEHGLMPSSVIEYNDLIYLYYSGWQRGFSVPYNNYTGLAISKDGGKTFKKYSESPILDRKNQELYSATSPCVLKEDDFWHMWYCSGTHWLEVNGKLEHTYDIKYAKSIDGKIWDQTGKISIQQKNKFEAITKPAVIKINQTYHMWFCYRGSQDFRDGIESYKIGYALSSDGTNWERNDALSGIETSKEGWDSKMIAYPEIKKNGNQIIMLYNGNSFGKEGFGWAILNKNHD